ncbi:hypothetical protein [Geodermatophilus sp. URMC 64]
MTRSSGSPDAGSARDRLVKDVESTAARVRRTRAALVRVNAAITATEADIARTEAALAATYDDMAADAARRGRPALAERLRSHSEQARQVATTERRRAAGHPDPVPPLPGLTDPGAAPGR